MEGATHFLEVWNFKDEFKNIPEDQIANQGDIATIDQLNNYIRHTSIGQMLQTVAIFNIKPKS